MKARVRQRSLTVGQAIQGRYEVSGVLGDGGFAEVYLANDLRLGREVAVKVLRLDLLEAAAAAETLARFEQEARLAAQINHRHVVAVYDYGSFEGRPFIVMERLQGRDLREELREAGPLAPWRLWPLFAQALEGLACAHARGIIHKDLKPANLFLVKEGDQEELRVLDFGVARALRGEVELTTQGQILGTPMYYAPEYIRKLPISPAVDVYQMGLILAELLCGEPVVWADDPYACVIKHTEGDLELPAALLNGPLGPVLLKATALDPRDRYPDAQAFRKDFLSVSPGQLLEVSGSGRVSVLEVSGSNRSVVVAPSPPTLALESRAVAAPRSRWVGAAVAVSAFGLLLVAAVAVALWWAKTPQAVEISVEKPVAPAPEPVVEAAPALAEAPPVVAPTPAVAAPPARVKVETDPPGATVTIKETGAELGESPVELDWAEGQEVVTLALRKKGYQDAEVTARRGEAMAPFKMVPVKPQPRGGAKKNPAGYLIPRVRSPQ